ncbi:hypothetical protein KY335_02000 [Candidatus Woesearchaeota archaeon]|nr:hypothetical protein [Candidatus Woesearchaeota archaeon]
MSSNKLEGKIGVIGTQKTFKALSKLLGANSDLSFQHLGKVVRGAIEAINPKDRESINLLFVDNDHLRKSEDSVNWIKMNLRNAEIILLYKNGGHASLHLDAVQKGAFGMLDLDDVENTNDSPSKDRILELSGKALKRSIRKQKSPIRNAYADSSDQMVLEDVVAGVDILSSEFWDADRRARYLDSKFPSEIKIVACDTPESRISIRTVTYGAHPVLVHFDGSDKPTFFLKVSTNPKGGRKEYIAPAIYEVDSELEKEIWTSQMKRASFATVQYEGYSRTESGLFYILKYRNSPTIDYYFLLYAPKVKDLKDSWMDLESTRDMLYPKIREFLSKSKEIDIDKLMSMIADAIGKYSPILDQKIIRAGAAHILKLLEVKQSESSLDDLLLPNILLSNPIFIRLDEVLKQKKADFFNYERARDKLIYDAIYAIADNDARWTINASRIADKLKLLTGDPNAKITDHKKEAEHNDQRLEKYLKSIFLYRCERDLRQGGATESAIQSTVSSFKLFSDKVPTIISEKDFEKVKKLFSDVLGEKEFYVLTQGDMRLQHMFFDDAAKKPEIFDYGRAKEERRGISAIEFLIDHFLDLSELEIGRFLSKYYKRFLGKYKVYSSRFAGTTNTALFSEDRSTVMKERRACYLMTILYRFRKMGPVAKDRVMYSCPIHYPTRRISYPYSVETSSGNLGPDHFRDINPRDLNGVDYHSADYIVDFHLSAIRKAIESGLSEQGKKLFSLTKPDQEALKILDSILSSHEICIETKDKVIKKRVSLYGKSCEVISDNGNNGN